MRHLGDITLIKGNEAPTVDCIIGGSPCQDLSLAGKRAGLAGARSGLYMEQIRIIKEMRENDRVNGRTGVDVRPRYMVWENVPGAFSTNKGQDFAAVLEEAIRVAEPEAPNVSVPEKGWPTAGCIVGDCWSVAWRVLDAQFWGTSDKPLPQRRRRIALVADFGGLSAPEILFVRKSVSGDIEPGKPKGKEAPRDAGEGSQTADKEGVPYTMQVRCGCAGGGKGALIQTDKSATLSTSQVQTLFQPTGVSYAIQGSMIGRADKNGPQGDGVNEDVSFTLNTTDRHAVSYSIENHPADSRVDIDPTGKVQTLTSRMGTGGGNVPMVMEQKKCYCIGNGQADQAGLHDIPGALNCMHDQQAVLIAEPMAVYALDQQGGKGGANYAVDVMPTLCSDSHGTPHAIAYAPDVDHALKAKANCDFREDSETYVVVSGVDCRNGTEIDEQTASLQAVAGHSLNGNNVVRVNYIVRRLTPLECERLQGFPDGWTDIGEWVDSKGKKHKEADSPRYKALGNSIALPPWKWVLKRLCACYERDATMASLFDGIGGFPLIWEQINGKGSCLWASEIEEFPMAVTKLRFGGGDNG